MEKEISVVGTGTMGSGIAQSALVSGYCVILIGHSEESANAGLERLKSGFEKALSKGTMTKQEGEEYMKNLTVSWNIGDVKSADIIIEAVPEELNTKLEVLSEIEKNASNDAIIASNTSSISINSMAASLHNPQRFMGMHFFNPVPVMKLVEAVRSNRTSEQTVAAAKAFAESMGKTVVVVNDSPGFISNRILMVFINESIKSLEEGVATKEAIDTIAKLGFNHPMGPIELADFIGLDVCADIMQSIYVQTNDPRFEPAKLLKKMVGDGRLGKKARRGFYDY